MIQRHDAWNITPIKITTTDKLTTTTNKTTTAIIIITTTVTTILAILIIIIVKIISLDNYVIIALLKSISDQSNTES